MDIREVYEKDQGEITIDQSEKTTPSLQKPKTVADKLKDQANKQCKESVNKYKYLAPNHSGRSSSLSSPSYFEEKDDVSLSSSSSSISSNSSTILLTKKLESEQESSQNSKYTWQFFNKNKNYPGQNETKHYLNHLEQFSVDKKQHIKIEKKSDKLLYSGTLLLEFSDVYCQLSFGTLGTESLLVVDCANSRNCDEFVARIKISYEEELNFSAPFDFNKRDFLEMIKITKIYEDRLLSKRNDAFFHFVEMLKERIKNISDDLNCREDFLQLMMIVRSHNLSLNKPLLLLKEIIQSKYISREVKEFAEHLRDVEFSLLTRNRYFPKFNVSTEMPDLFQRMRDVCMEGIDNHRRNLINECPNKNFKLVCLVVNVNNLLDKRVLFINKQDIKLFADLLEFMNEQNQDENVPTDFVKNLWNKFFKRIETEDQNKALKTLGLITHPIYYFLLKSLFEIVSEIHSKIGDQAESLISFVDGDIVTKESFSWEIHELSNKSLEEQYHLLRDLIKHFEPGVYTHNSSYNYTFKLLKENEDVSLWKTIKNMSKERCVWLYIVDSGLAPVLSDNSTARFKELSQPVLNAFVKFIQEVKQERYETFRVVTHNIIKFVTRISPYICTVYSVLTNIDYNILNKQIDVINSSLISENKDTVSDHFSTLLMIYNEYWENRDSIVEKLPIPCSIFKPNVELIMQKLLKVVQNAFMKSLEVPGRIKFLRLYNEFLKHLQGIQFTWFISKFIYSSELEGIVEKIKNNDVTSYRVIEPEDFIEVLKKNEKQIPKHFLLETIKELLEIVNMALNKVDWKDEECVEAAGDLFLAIGHSFTHFEDQVDYKDLEHFLKDCTMPFYCVIENSSTYSDFKRRLENVENFYVYVRKQNQIGVHQAIDLCEEEVCKVEKNGFDTKINRSILVECYDRYLKNVLSLEGLETEEILNKMEEELKKVKKYTVDKWTKDFKQNSIPLLLAYLSSIWSIQESKDVTIIKKRIEPHCVQILCIFRLLGVDQDSVGVPKHFAQILTGQGKSLVLALISALFALTNNEAFVVCYSSYLAQRDKSYFKQFFSLFRKFNLNSKISYNTFDDMADKVLSRNINGSEISLRTVIKELVLNKLQTQVITPNWNPENTVLLIDEADVFFNENFYGKAWRPLVLVPIPALLKVQPKLWDIVKEGVSEKRNISRQIWDFIGELLKDENYSDFRIFLKCTSVLFEKELDMMIKDAIHVSNLQISDELDKEYKINEDGFICTKDSFGIYRSSIYSGYQNAFNYFRLQKENYDHKSYSNFGYLQASLGSISYASLPARYNNILGVSGTLLNLCEYERNALKNYGVQTLSAIPSFFGERKLIFNPIKDVSIQSTQVSWLSKIFESVSKNIQLHRAVLVFFKTDTEMELFQNNYQSSIDRLYTLTGNEDSNTLEWRINEAGVAQTVTLATRAMGRGIDYKSNDRSVEENGGIHVIQTFFSLDEKEEIQIKGRTARKNNKGSYELILNLESITEMCRSSSYTNFSRVNTYYELCNFRLYEANRKGKSVDTSKKETEKDHNMTMEFFDSLSQYSPEKRDEYL